MTIAVFLGDSTTNTATPHGWYAAARLGWDTPTILAFGGIGYCQSQPNGDGRFGGGTLPYGPFSNPQILALVDAANPDVIVCEGGLNDSAYSDAVVGAAAGALYDYLIAHHPAATLYVVSPYYMRTPVTSVLLTRAAAIKAEAAARGLLYIDMLTVPWITGTGCIGNENGDGNGDVYTIADTTHPSPAGSRYTGTRLAFAIRPPSTGLVA